MAVSQSLSISLVSQDKTNNQSTVKIMLQSTQSGASYNNTTNTGYYWISINGGTETKYSFQTTLPANSTKTCFSTNKTFSHRSDGTASIKVRTSLNTYISAGTVTTSKTYTPPTIPRASSISAGTFTMGSAGTITISKANASFTDTITYKFGDKSDKIVENTTATSVPWTPNLSVLAPYILDSTSGQGTLTCTTRNGSSTVGSKSISVTVKLPNTSSVNPTVSNFSCKIDNSQNTIVNGWGLAVAGYTKVKMTANAAGVYGSKIKSFNVMSSNGGTNYETKSVAPSSGALNYTTLPITSGGDYYFKIQSVDTRDKVSSTTGITKITVYPYSKPSISRFTVSRSQQNDTQMVVDTKWTYSTVNGKNSATIVLQYKKSTATSWTTYPSAITNNASTTLSAAFDKSSSYQFKLSITDTLGNNDTENASVTTSAVLLDFKAGGKGISIGKYAETDNLFECALNAKFNGTVQGKGIVDLIYPIGSIYISANSTSPATLFGGSWEQIKDVFLIGASNTYPVGATGGSKTHTLTTNEMPAHKHIGYRFISEQLGAGTKGARIYAPSSTTEGTTGAYTTEVGGGAAHNNMPPYLSVYMWKRKS